MDDLTQISIQGMSTYGDLNMESQALPTMNSQADNKKIKRPMNAFLLFCKDKRQSTRGENPDMKNVDVSQVLAEQWKNLDDAQKLRYRALAAEQQKAFKEENPDYKYEKAKAKHLLNRQKLRPEFRHITNVLDVKTLLSMTVDDAKAYLLFLTTQTVPQNQVNDQLIMNTYQ